MKAGILALQGCIEPHIEMCSRIGVLLQRVSSPEELQETTHLILPGGESTSMLTLLERSCMFDALKNFVTSKPAWGICAGAILLSREVLHPAQKSLAALPLRARRNHYGCQLDSFSTELSVEFLETPLEADFIRAPLLEPLSSEIKILARHNEHPVLFRYGRTLASAFHTELGKDSRLHEYFFAI